MTTNPEKGGNLEIDYPLYLPAQHRYLIVNLTTNWQNCLIAVNFSKKYYLWSQHLTKVHHKNLEQLADHGDC